MYGLASRVKSDKVEESTLIWSKNIKFRGEGCGSYNEVSSVYNQSIECSAQDAWSYICS